MSASSQSPVDLALHKHADFIVRSFEPFNAGPPPSLLSQEVVTPASLFFVRNHGSVPQIDPDTYRLTVGGLVERALELSLDELRQMPSVTVEAAIQCAGNRRVEMDRVREIPGELLWDLEAVSNGTWTGVRLGHVLGQAGFLPATRHVGLTGLDEVERRGQVFGFGGSIPLNKALGDEVILAYVMNGEPLTPLHGAPLRLVVPGYIGARSVKWLGEITLQAEPSDNYFQTVAYRLYPAHITSETAESAEGRMLGDVFGTAVICQPVEGDHAASDRLAIRGYAIGHGGSTIESVEVSADGGRTWAVARLLGDRQPWSWQLWEAIVDLVPGTRTLIARAFDAHGMPQPQTVRETWNFKGYMNNALHRVTVHVD